MSRQMTDNESSRTPGMPDDGNIQSPIPNTQKRLPAWAILLGVGILFVAGLMALLWFKPPQKFLCDQAAPDFTMTTFPGYQGGLPSETLKLSDLRGKGVVLNFWASWCKPCEEEAAALETAWQMYKGKGIVFVGVDFYDQEPAARRYLEKFKITYPNGPDLGGTASKRYGTRAVPETFFISPEGKIIGCRKEGPLSDAELRQRIAEIMPR